MSTVETPWRGPSFPLDPIMEQTFYLDVPNGSDPPNGWYVFRTSLTAGRAGGEWVPCARPASDHGDLVRGSTRVKRHDSMGLR